MKHPPRQSRIAYQLTNFRDEDGRPKIYTRYHRRRWYNDLVKSLRVTPIPLIKGLYLLVAFLIGLVIGLIINHDYVLHYEPHINPIKLVLAKPLPSSTLQPVATVQPIYVAPVATVVAAPAIADVVNCGSDPYMAQIYMRESGCSTTRTNSIGCVGLGQACPGSKLYAVCPTLDWTCENNFFTGYAAARYGSPAQAWAVWQLQLWW